MTRAVLASACATAVAAATLAVATTAPAQAAPRQGAIFSVSPGIAQNGARAGSAVNASLYGAARFSPVRPGRPVIVQRRVAGGRWQTAARLREDAGGRVEFVRDAALGARPYVYRAVARGTDALPQKISPSGSSSAWRVRFDETFSGSSLTDRWSARMPGVLHGTRTHAESSLDAVHVGGGAVDLQVRRNPARDPDPLPYYLNGHISTSGTFSFRYGYAAARVKFAQGQGQHGAFWMQPQSRLAPYGDPALTGTEVDVAEFFGQGYRNGGIANYVYTIPDASLFNVKHGALRASALDALTGPDDTWWSRYHVFSVLWTASGYTFRIDGQLVSQIPTAVSKRPEYLVLSLLSSDWELPRLDTSTLPTSMKVDWVRVWQR